MIPIDCDEAIPEGSKAEQVGIVEFAGDASEFELVATLKVSFTDLAAVGVLSEERAGLSCALIKIGDVYFLLEAERSSSLSVSVKGNWAASYLDALLQCLGLTTESISMKEELGIVFRPHEFWRQGDDGNPVMISVLPSKADAIYKVREFTERGHRQLYWTRPAGH